MNNKDVKRWSKLHTILLFECGVEKCMETLLLQMSGYRVGGSERVEWDGAGLH